MNRFLVITLVLLGWVQYTAGQNLVLNASFEDTLNCPSAQSQIYNAPPWFQLTEGTPDYFHQCGVPNFSWVPVNIAGYQYPNTGVAYAGLIVEGFNEHREYITALLAIPLIMDKMYYAEVHINYADFWNDTLGSDGIGMLFTEGKPDTSGVGQGLLPYTPQVNNVSGNIINDTVNWVKVSGTFMAIGGEDHITIGNFRTNANTQGSGYFFYVDDVLVMEDTTIGVAENTGKDGLLYEIYPNPFREKTVIRYHLPETATQGVIMVFDLQGKLLKTFNLSERGDGEVEIDGGELYPGMFIYSLVVDGQEIANKRMILTD